MTPVLLGQMCSCVSVGGIHTEPPAHYISRLVRWLAQARCTNIALNGDSPLMR